MPSTDRISHSVPSIIELNYSPIIIKNYMVSFQQLYSFAVTLYIIYICTCYALCEDTQVTLSKTLSCTE